MFVLTGHVKKAFTFNNLSILYIPKFDQSLLTAKHENYGSQFSIV